MRRDVLAGLDPRARIAAFLVVQALIFIPGARTPSIRLGFVAIPLLLLLPFAGRAWYFWLRTITLAAPFLAFVALSTCLSPFAGRPEMHFVILALLGRSLLVFLSLALFVLTEEPGRLLQAIRQAGFPQSALVIMAIGLRFAGEWRLELENMRRSWTGRNFNTLPKRRRARYISRMLPLFFEKLLDSGTHVHEAMVSRGFRGILPSWQYLIFSKRDALFLVVVAMAAVAITLL